MDRRRFFGVAKKNVVLPNTPWQAFKQRIQRFVKGAWEDYPNSMDGYERACLTLERMHDYDHVADLAKQYEVVLVLEGLPYPINPIGRSGLWLKLSPSLNQCEDLNGQACVAQAGVCVGDLLAQGYRQFERVPANLNVAQWLADPQYHDVRSGYSYLSGVERVFVHFSNGDQAVLGGFGVNDASPLTIALLHRAIPKLFEILQTPTAQKALNANRWPYTYRVESLQKNRVDSNIARVFLGSLGSLVWVQSVVIRKMPKDGLQLAPSLKHSPQWFEPLGLDAHDRQVILEADTQVKNAFDEIGLFPYLDELQLML